MELEIDFALSFNVIRYITSLEQCVKTSDLTEIKDCGERNHILFNTHRPTQAPHITTATRQRQRN